jgi:hypothetical protein
MKLFGKNFSPRRGYTSLIVLVLSLFFFVEAIAAAGDIFFPIVYHDIQPTPTITPTPTLIPGGAVILPNHYAFTTSTGTLHVVGEIQNNTTYTLQRLRVTANFYNSSNQWLETESELVFMNDLPPGAKTCFNLSLDVPEGYSYYQFDPVTYQTNGEPLPDLTLLNVSGAYNSQFDYYRISGSVRNDEDVTVYDVRLVGTLYNLTGKVIGCKFTSVAGGYLDTDDTSSFEILYTERDYVDAATYRVQADGDIP